METQLAKINKLIDKGDNVLSTHRPNPPNVIGFSTCNSELFTTWKTQALSFLQFYCGISSPYYSEFLSKVSTPHIGQIKIGLGILKAIKEEYEENNEILKYSESNQLNKINFSTPKKVFISHSTKDKAII